MVCVAIPKEIWKPKFHNKILVNVDQQNMMKLKGS